MEFINIKNKINENIILKNCALIEKTNNNSETADIVISEGIIKDINFGANVSDSNFKTIDCSGFYVLPGFTDMHVHIREPGSEGAEDYESAVKSALRGGITSMAVMPNTDPVNDMPFLTQYSVLKSGIFNFNIYPVAAMTKNLEGEEITEMGLLKKSGALAFSDDGKAVQNSKIMYEIMKYAADLGVLLILHEEDYDFSFNGQVHEGYYSSKSGLKGISSLSEDLMIARDIILAKKTKARIHFTHLSTAGSVEMIRAAKKEGIAVTCDTTPHHLFFDDSCIEQFDTSFKIKPPIRSKEDRKALIEGLRDGTIDAVASDHAPHKSSLKKCSFSEASFGTIGMETMFKAVITKLCRQEKFSLEKAVSLITSKPAEILGINAGKIAKGAPASLTIADTDSEKVYLKEDIVSKSKNSCFTGSILFGEIRGVIANGKICFLNF